MKRRTLIASIGAVAGTTLGAAAYTSATINRSASIDVVTDDTGLIGLGTGTSGGLITYDSGALTIDVTKGGASGVNVDSTLTFGDETDAANSYAFTLKNNDTAARDITLAYTGMTDPDETIPHVQFKVYDSNGDAVATETDGTTISSIADETNDYIISGAGTDMTYHVVLAINTTDLDSTADLSGTLSITA